MGLFFVGCDSTSSFHGKGKKTAWKTLVAFPEFAESFSMLGREIPPSDLVNELNKFTCLMYGDKTSTNVDDCRYSLFKSGKCSDDVLPPMCDSLVQHINRANFQRANFQTASWCQCLNAEVAIPSPVGNGWTLTDAELEIVWMTRQPAPQSLLECVECKCKTGCTTMRCSCRKADLKCTDLCSCSDCQNTAHEDQDKEEDDEEVEDNDMVRSDDEEQLEDSDSDFGDD